jgi:hypothetical protein
MAILDTASLVKTGGRIHDMLLVEETFPPLYFI